MPALPFRTSQGDESGAGRLRSCVRGVVAVVACVVMAAVLAAACGGGDAGVGEEASVPPVVTEGSVATATVVAPVATVTATAEPEPPTATPTRTPVPGPPYNVHVSVNYVPYPDRTDHLVESNDLIIVGRVVEVLPARWTTADGVRPEDPFTTGRQYTIITPAVLEIEEVLLDRAGLDLEGARVLVATIGGEVGADSVTQEPPLVLGSRLFGVLTPFST